MEFTKEEINLCKQIAEKHRKSLKNFDLVIGTYLSGEEFIGYFHEELIKEKLMKAKFDEVMVSLCGAAKTTKPMIPLWTISDCLEFLQEREDVIELWRTGRRLIWFCRLGNHKWKSGNSPLEACLKAVLAMLEEE